MKEFKFVIPTRNDILCGRGRTIFNHPGNRRLRHQIASTLDKYDKCTSRRERTEIIRDIIDVIMIDNGGRFLKCIPNTSGNGSSDFIWYDGGIETAKIRVSTAFRDARIPNKVKCMEVLKRSTSSASASEAEVGSSTQTSVKNFGTKSKSLSCLEKQDSKIKKTSSSSISLYDESSLPSLTSYLMTADLIPYPTPTKSTAASSIIKMEEKYHSSYETIPCSSSTYDDDDDNDDNSVSTSGTVESLFSLVDKVDFDDIITNTLNEKNPKSCYCYGDENNDDDDDDDIKIPSLSNFSKYNKKDGTFNSTEFDKSLNDLFKQQQQLQQDICNNNLSQQVMISFNARSA